jgi:WD40 repeat protein
MSLAPSSQHANVPLLSGGPVPILSFHYGPTWAVSICPSRSGSLAVTGGDDRWVCLWDLVSFSLAGRARAKAPVRCLHVDSSGGFIAVGMVAGAFSVFYLEKSRPKQTATRLLRREEAVTYTLHELATQRDCMEDLSDIKFSPNDKMVAVGSHDNFIDIYATNFVHPDLNTSASCNLRRLKRLRGHTSYITHLDWSDNNKYLQSTCGAYELLYWDVTTGKQALSSFDSLEADTTWKTGSCVLGFNVMGIWPKYSDGTDVNAVDVSRTKRVCITG